MHVNTPAMVHVSAFHEYQSRVIFLFQPRPIQAINPILVVNGQYHKVKEKQTLELECNSFEFHQNQFYSNHTRGGMCQWPVRPQ